MPDFLRNRQAHNLKVAGSIPTPKTNYINKINGLDHPQELRFLGFFVVFILYTNWSLGFLFLINMRSSNYFLKGIDIVRFILILKIQNFNILFCFISQKF